MLLSISPLVSLRHKNVLSHSHLLLMSHSRLSLFHMCFHYRNALSLSLSSFGIYITCLEGYVYVSSALLVYYLQSIVET
jgi:hypothetical protein